MPNSRRNKRIDKKKAALTALGNDPSGLSVLLSLAQENPGQPLRTFIRARIKEILTAHPDKPELLVDVSEILDALKNETLRRERILAAKKEPKVPPFSLAAGTVLSEGIEDRFQWAYKFDRNSEVIWNLQQV